MCGIDTYAAFSSDGNHRKFEFVTHKYRSFYVPKMYPGCLYHLSINTVRIIIGSDRRPETEQEI